MTDRPDEAPLARAIVDLHRTPRGALEVHVRALLPTRDLGRVPLDELTVLLEALAVDAGAGAGPEVSGGRAGTGAPDDG